MCLRSTTRARAATCLLAFIAAGLCALHAQSANGAEWRRIGNAALEAGLPSVSTGPVDRVWYSDNGQQLLVRTTAGRIFNTSDFEHWLPAAANAAPPASPLSAPADTVPETGARFRSGAQGGRVWAFHRDAYRSDDGGAHWRNLTNYKNSSLLGGPILDLAASPTNPDEIVAGTETGVWRSVDAGLSWAGINEQLPNLPVQKILGLPRGARGVRLGLGLGPDTAVEWMPGEKRAWRPSRQPEQDRESAMRREYGILLGASITAVATGKETVYAGAADGRLWASLDAGHTWRTAYMASSESGPVESIVVNPKDNRNAWAALGARKSDVLSGTRVPHILRTINGGLFWDDLSANLPDTAAHGIAVDFTGSAVYAATSSGLYSARADAPNGGAVHEWTAVNANIPAGIVRDVQLDAQGNQIFVAIDGYGVYVGIAPHRLQEAHVVNAADYSNRAAAPGSLLSVLGARVQAGRSSAGDPIPVLDANESASQIQVPFAAKGQSVLLSLEAAAGHLDFELPLQNTSPAIFIDPDGTPMILDAATGMPLDSLKPAKADSTIQVLVTGLGRVEPEWSAGLAAPLTDSPRVVEPVQAFVDGSPAEVSDAALAPGYIGFYLVQIHLPRIQNAGPAELYLQSGGQMSNRVRVYLEP